MAKDFSHEEDKRLIKQVAKHPAIFDLTSPLYKEQNVKESNWKDIEAKVGRSTEDCKWRWKNIKDTYNKRKRRTATNTNSSHISKKEWHLLPMLKFLEHVEIKSRRKSSKVKNESADDVLSGDISDTPAGASSRKTLSKYKPTLIRKRRLKTFEVNKLVSNVKKKSVNQEDHVDVFFKSIAMSVKVLPSHLINVAKMRSLQMVNELEDVCAANEQYAVNAPHTTNNVSGNFSTSSSTSGDSIPIHGTDAPISSASFTESKPGISDIDFAQL